MSMYKRPSQRVKIDHDGQRHAPAREGSFLYNLLNPPPTKFPMKIKQPVYHQDDYLKLLKSSNERMGLKYVDPGLPIVTHQRYTQNHKKNQRLLTVTAFKWYSVY